jgi:hypothetical protein
MIELKYDDKFQLAECIQEALRDEFEFVHLSKNLINTMYIKIDETNNSVSVEIPAMKYNVKKFRETGVIKYYYKGSYAEAINKSGGFSGKHTDYIENCILKGIQKWLTQKGIEGKVSISE